MIWHVVRRVGRARLVDQVIVATSMEAADEPIVEFCRSEGIGCYRGSLDDVLDRFYHAARHFSAGTVVRVTADCPLIDPEVIDEVVGIYQTGDYDYASNILEPTYPDGLDTEVFSLATLDRTWHEARWQSEREHVTPYMKSPDRFRIVNVANTQDLSTMRWTVDEPEDLRFVRAVYGLLGDRCFAMDDILAVLDENPELTRINAGIGRNEGLEESLRHDRLMDAAR